MHCQGAGEPMRNACRFEGFPASREHLAGFGSPSNALQAELRHDLVRESCDDSGGPELDEGVVTEPSPTTAARTTFTNS